MDAPKIGTRIEESDAYVLEAHKNEKNGNVVVLLFLPNHPHTPFATAILVSMRGWMYGHYFENVNEALSDFMERA